MSLSRPCLILVLILFSTISHFDNLVYGQEVSSRRDFRIMFYNVENLFDYINDSLTLDDEFLPDGTRHWTINRYKQKLNNIYKVIVSAGGWEPPEIVGLCEIENKFVLEGLVNNTPLAKYNYNIIHKESPDQRGIDVALLYIENKFKILQTRFIQITHANISLKTRNILFVKGITSMKDTLNIFVNHWASRYSGQIESKKKRSIIASILRQQVDSIFNLKKKTNIIIMGDFNDEPLDKSILQILGSKIDYSDIMPGELYNLSYVLWKNNNKGSCKYKGAWFMFDQFIVSASLLQKENQLYLQTTDIHLFCPDFLLEEDEMYFGLKPYRTYNGYQYQGGFSDHLPIYIDLKRKRKIIK
jgi:predicted extracellular nuclease